MSAIRLWSALVLALLLVGLLAVTARAQQSGPTVDVLEIAGPLDPAMARYLSTALDTAAADDVEVVVVQLDTPGSLDTDINAFVEPVRSSPVPVVVWVGPPGAAASGAGVDLAMAAHVFGMAPASVLGPPSPAGLDGGDAVGQPAFGLDTGEAIVVSAGQPAGANGLPPGTELPPGVESDAVRVDAAEALVKVGRIGFVADSLDDVLRELDGRRVEVAAPGGGRVERRLDVDPVTTAVRFNNPGLLARVLHALANPALVYLLLIAGALAIAFELFQPGLGVAGLSGLVLIALAAYGLAVLPVSWWALALVLAGLAILAVDLALAGLGLATLAGTAALAAGSVRLFDLPSGYGLSGWLVGFTVAATVVFFVVVMTTVLRAQGQAMAGADQVVGEVGVVRSMLNPEGHVFVGGALWRARVRQEAGKVGTGTRVRVTGLGDGLALDVELADVDSDASRPSRA